MDTDGLVDTVEATCPQVLEQLEDELLTVSTAPTSTSHILLFFLLKNKDKETESGHL